MRRPWILTDYGTLTELGQYRTRAAAGATRAAILAARVTAEVA